ncbi:MAG TPA: sulfatase [Planctomycetota bacterium]
MRRLLPALALLVAACGSEPARVRRNVILITLDTTRADHLSCYGRAGEATPHLDRLAAEGTRFDLALSTASVTPVAHASILTGRYNHEHGLRVLFADGGYRLSGAARTLAEVLAAEGYDTLAVHSAFPVSRFFGLERGFARFDDLQADVAEGEGEFRWDVARFQRRSDETSARVLAALGPAPAEPFFLWVHYWDPHDLARLPPGLGPRQARALDLPEGVQPFYAEEITYMDAQIGQLFEELRARGLYEETLIVVVADHGQGLMDHGWAHHRLLYQEQIRVPLLVRLPGLRQQPVVEELVRTVDVFPTVLDVLGIPLPEPVSGRSLRALIEGRSDAPRTAFADQINGYDWNAGMVRERPLDDFLYAVVQDGWKLVYRPKHLEASELYHLAEDPREERDLFAAEPARARALLAELAREAPWVVGPFEPLSAGVDRTGVQETLSQLGYTGTEPVEAEWSWTCAEHLDQRREERAPCPQCGAAPLLIGR